MIRSVLLGTAVSALVACGGGEDPAATGGSSAAPAGNVITTELPPELLEGTPVPMKVPDLVQVPHAAPRVAAPQGTVLLSANKPVTSSDEFPFGELSYLTDGDKQAGEGYYVEIQQGLQWVQIDLEASHELAGVWVWHYHSQRRAYHDVVIQVSDDPGFNGGVTTIYNNDYDNSSGLGQGGDAPYVESRFGMLADAKGAKGRYVRLYSNGNTADEQNHYTEVEVFGLPAPE